MLAEKFALVRNLNSFDPSDQTIISARLRSKPPMPLPCRSGSMAAFSIGRCEGAAISSRQRAPKRASREQDAAGEFHVLVTHSARFFHQRRNKTIRADVSLS